MIECIKANPHGLNPLIIPKPLISNFITEQFLSLRQGEPAETWEVEFLLMSEDDYLNLPEFNGF